MIKINKYEFIENIIKEVEKELKDRKKWKKDLIREYGLQRTWKYNQQGTVLNMIKAANVMINHYNTILEEYKNMLKELNEI